jgi:hypothetical protein
VGIGAAAAADFRVPEAERPAPPRYYSQEPVESYGPSSSGLRLSAATARCLLRIRPGSGRSPARPLLPATYLRARLWQSSLPCAGVWAACREDLWRIRSSGSFPVRKLLGWSRVCGRIFLQQRQRRGHILWSWTAPMRHCPDVLRFRARSQRATEPLLPWRGAHHFEHREHVEFLSASRNIPGVGRPGRDGLRQPKCFEIT